MPGLFQSTVTARGQVTIPVEVRRRLGLKAGDTVVIQESDTGYVISWSPRATGQAGAGAVSSASGGLRGSVGVRFDGERSLGE
ncbi:MAG: AbrB/MazE/SpoVT family DNA-binding domain-containing protein [Clostridia bacterium]|nr:AbrB/MazE/SpoVT family DNA-binding domain-containing protein [Clostridia bacterium]